MASKRARGEASTTTWLVTLAPGAKVDQVAAGLAKAGLAVTSSLAEVGVVVGTAPKRTVAALRKVKGVANVSPDVDVSVGRPDDPESW